MPGRNSPEPVQPRGMSNILRSLERNVGDTPDKAAVTGSHASLTWRELHDEVLAVSAMLQGSGVLGLFMENSPAWIVADLSAVHAGVINVPLPGFFSEKQIQHAIQDAKIDTVITDNPERVRSLFPGGREVRLKIAGKLYTQIFFPAESVDRKGNTAVKVTYTSGTTGSPRGVLLSLGMIETVAASLAEAANAGREDRALVVLPLSILLENIGSVYVPILAGAEILVPDSAELGLSGSSRIDAELFAEAMQRLRPTAMILPPQLLKLLVALAERQLLPDSLRFIAVGGAPVGIALLDAARQAGLPVYQGYGLSEACSVVALNTADNNYLGSVGRPLPHNEVRVNESGEIVITGISFNGYLNEPARNPEGELATGDLGYLDEEGYLYVTGRTRNRIITGFGRNVSPEWVESELLSYPLIAQAAVFGNNLPHLVAVLVLASQDAGEAVIESIIEEVNERLPDYARIGSHVIASSPFSVSSGELAVSGSPCRVVIEEHYSTQINNQPEVQNEQLFRASPG
jgi:long-chain acyl-CoA synthetase